MKTIVKLLFATTIILFGVIAGFSNASASDDIINLEFKVSGNCTMCKKTIESSLKGKEGIQSAVWDQKSKIIKVKYDSQKISEDQIHSFIAASGYDTSKRKAVDKAYNSLPECCQYDRTLHSK